MVYPQVRQSGCLKRPALRRMPQLEAREFIHVYFTVPRDKWFIRYAHIHLYEPEVDALVLKYNDYIAADPFWADLIPGGSDQNIFGGS